MKKLLLLFAVAIIGIGASRTIAQNVMNPADPIVNFNPSSPPASTPGSIQKWVVTEIFSWDSGYYKAYHFNGVSYRLMFPRSYNHGVQDGKKYPLMLFFHGAGETGTIYANELQIGHGGELFMNRVKQNLYDGFLLFPQNQSGSFNASHFQTMAQVLDTLSKYNKLDLDRVMVSGLSAGGYASFDMMASYPTKVAGATPSASIAIPLIGQIANFVHIPVWVASGGKDISPDTGSVRYFLNAFEAAGGVMRWTMYPDKGHFMWYDHWNESDYIPYMNEVHKANPLIYFGNDKFCSEAQMNAKLGITAGFAQYQWSRNDTSSVISGATSNEYIPTSFGTYYVRFKRTSSSPWSRWSPKPAVISGASGSVTPDPQIVGLRSRVLPSPDGSTTVPLSIPQGFSSYEWVRVSDNAVVDNDYTYDAPPGQYKVRVGETQGCSSGFSNIFTVVNANGPNKPDPARDLSAVAVSANSVRLDWSDNPSPAHNETNFEIYRSTGVAGPYTLVAITNANIYTYTDLNLQINTKYYYLIRAVNSSAAAPVSKQVSVTTVADLVAPTAPGNLRQIGGSRNSIYLQWDPSTDNVGVARYDVYVNGNKLYSSTKTIFEVTNLENAQTYSIAVKARDAAGNSSSLSNQVTAYTKLQGLTYFYYEGGWSSLPDFSALPVIEAGTTSAFDIGPRNRNDQFGFVWNGYLKIPSTGNYTFEVCSDDGSKLYLNQFYSPGATANINNDGAHGYQCVTTTMSLTANAIIPISATYFDGSGGEQMEVYWSNNVGLSRQQIPASAFSESGNPSGSVPAAPSNLSASAVSHERINLGWTDNSGNETGFEIVRATSSAGPYVNVATVASGVTNYSDLGLAAATTYYYKVRAIGSGGESAYTSGSGGGGGGTGSTLESNWKLNNDLSDASGNSSRALYNSATTFNGSDKQEGSSSASFASSPSYLVPLSSQNNGFPSDGGYAQRTIGLWIKPANTSNKQIVFEFGGADNGLGLRITGNTLQAGVASGNARVNISTAFTAANTWTHVAVVYKNNTLKLFVNGNQAASNNSLGFSSIAGSSSSLSVFGYTDHNVFNDAGATYQSYQGLMDNIYVVNGELAAAEIATLMNNTYQSSGGGNPGDSWATTQPLPGAPAVPGPLTTTASSPTSINVNWTDNSSNETLFEVYRSTGNESQYRFLAIVTGDGSASKSYLDQELYPDIRYYYKVRAIGIGGPSSYSNSSSALTPGGSGGGGGGGGGQQVTETILVNSMKNSAAPSPWNNMTTSSMSSLRNTNGQTTSVAVEATNGNYVLFEAIGAQTGNNSGAYPDVVMKDFMYWGFGSNNNNFDNTELRISGLNPSRTYDITLFPSSIYQTYSTSNVTFSHGGQSVTVNAQNNTTNKAVLSQISPNASGVISITMTGDPDPTKGGFLNAFEITTTYTTSGGGGGGGNSLEAQWKLNNDYTDANGNPARTLYNSGTTFNSADKKEGGQSASFPSSGTPYLVPLSSQSNGFPSDGGYDQRTIGLWIRPNNTSTKQMIFDFGGADNGLGLQITGNTLQAGIASNNARVSTSTPFTAANAWTHVAIVYKANTLKLYVNGALAASNNALGFSSIAASSSSLSVFGWTDHNVFNQAGATYGGFAGLMDNIYVINGELSAAEIAQLMDGTWQPGGGTPPPPPPPPGDPTVPVSPTDLTGAFVPQKGVVLEWTDAAHNETSYKIYRSTSSSGPFSEINPGADNANSSSFTDGAATQPQTYYYYIVASNSVGNGTQGNTISVRVNGNPAITNLDNLFVKADNSATESFSVSDPGDVVTVSSPGLPSFLVLQNAGGDNYQLVANATKDHIGKYEVTIVARDNSGGESSAKILVHVADKHTRSFYINLGNTAAGQFYNDFLGAVTNGKTMSSLKDENGGNSSLNITSLSAWSGMVTNGHITGNNSGVVSDLALSSGVLANDNVARSFRFGGLNTSRRYNVVFVGSNNDGYPAVATYSAPGAASVTLNGRNNTNKSAQLNYLAPDASGNITVTLQKESASTFMYLNAIVIEEILSSATLLNPIQLFAEPASKTAVNLKWSERANGETGYEIWRSTSAGGPFAMIGSAPANSSSWTDNAATSNTRYFYQVRAAQGGVLSEFSNVAATITPKTETFVNLTLSFPGPNPWNNLNINPVNPAQVNNLMTDQNVSSGANIAITRIFNGQFDAGMQTFGSGGLYPNNVMRSNFWVDRFQVGQFVVSGLNQSKRYRFGFFGSTDPNSWYNADFTSTYTIGSRTVYLNANRNDSKVVYIGDVVPDQNGEVRLDLSTTAAADYGFTAVIIIQAYDDVAGGTVLNAVPTPAPEEITSTNPVAAPDIQRISMYPNPFSENLSISFHNTSASSRGEVEIFDMTGRVVHRETLQNIAAGMNTFRLNIHGKYLQPGSYLARLNLNGRRVASLKLLKTRR